MSDQAHALFSTKAVLSQYGNSHRGNESNMEQPSLDVCAVTRLRLETELLKHHDSKEKAWMIKGESWDSQSHELYRRLKPHTGWAPPC